MKIHMIMLSFILINLIHIAVPKCPEHTPIMGQFSWL
jgi:hypothetical protein